MPLAPVRDPAPICPDPEDHALAADLASVMEWAHHVTFGHGYVDVFTSPGEWERYSTIGEALR